MEEYAHSIHAREIFRFFPQINKLQHFSEPWAKKMLKNVTVTPPPHTHQIGTFATVIEDIRSKKNGLD